MNNVLMSTMFYTTVKWQYSTAFIVDFNYVYNCDINK